MMGPLQEEQQYQLQLGGREIVSEIPNVTHHLLLGFVLFWLLVLARPYVWMLYCVDAVLSGYLSPRSELTWLCSYVVCLLS